MHHLRVLVFYGSVPSGSLHPFNILNANSLSLLRSNFWTPEFAEDFSALREFVKEEPENTIIVIESNALLQKEAIDLHKKLMKKRHPIERRVYCIGDRYTHCGTIHDNLIYAVLEAGTKIVLP